MIPTDADSSSNEQIRERPLNAIGGGLVLRVGALAVFGAVVLVSLAIRTAVHGGHGGARFGVVDWGGRLARRRRVLRSRPDQAGAR